MTEAEKDSSSYDFSVMCRHCDKETTDPITASVSGNIPDYVDGTFLYNGPAITKIGTTEYQYCLDSGAMIQKITVSSSTGCQYQSRYLQTSTLSRNLSAGTITVTEFGTGAQTAASTGFLDRVRKMADVESLISDNSPVNVMKLGEKYYAIGDTPFLHQLDVDTLLVVEKRSLYRELGLVNQSPHSVLGEDGHSYGIAQSVGLAGPKYNIVKHPRDGSSSSVVAKVSPRWRMSPCLMHSVGMSENYLIMLEQPLAMSVTDLLADMLRGAPLMDCVKWHQDKVVLHVLDVRTWKPVKQKFAVDNLFMIHFANCYENEDGNVVVDFPSYPNAGMLKEMYISTLRTVKGQAARDMAKSYNNVMTRVIIPLNTQHNIPEVLVPTTTLSSCPMENPIVNPNYRRRRHRFIYASGQNAEGLNFGQVTKLDVDTGDVKSFSEDNLYTGQVLFIPKPGSQVEDDGVLVVVCVVSGRPQFGCLVFLDAASFTVIARVSYTPNAVVTMPMHGMFIPRST